LMSPWWKRIIRIYHESSLEVVYRHRSQRRSDSITVDLIWLQISIAGEQQPVIRRFHGFHENRTVTQVHHRAGGLADRQFSPAILLNSRIQHVIPRLDKRTRVVLQMRLHRCPKKRIWRHAGKAALPRLPTGTKLTLQRLL